MSARGNTEVDRGDQRSGAHTGAGRAGQKPGPHLAGHQAPVRPSAGRRAGEIKETLKEKSHHEATAAKAVSSFRELDKALMPSAPADLLSAPGVGRHVG